MEASIIVTSTLVVSAFVGALGFVLAHREKIRKIVELDWNTNLKKDKLLENCRVYFKNKGWEFVSGQQFINFRVKSDTVYIAIMTNDILQRSTAPESIYISAVGRRIRIATSTWSWRVICVVNFPVSNFGYETALKEGFVMLHYSDLDLLNKFLKSGDILLSDLDQLSEYVLSGSRPICRVYAKELMEKGDITGAIKWTTYAVRSDNQSGDDYVTLSKLYMSQKIFDKARIAATQAVNLDRTNKAYLACLAESDAAIRASIIS